jgi:hypothetical protein
MFSIMINLSSKQLRQAADLKERITTLEQEFDAILGGNGSAIPSPLQAAKTTKKGMSAAGRARIAAAQKARWAKVKAANPAKAVNPAQVTKHGKIKRTMSAAAKAKISAAAKKRWKKAKAAGKNAL